MDSSPVSPDPPRSSSQVVKIVIALVLFGIAAKLACPYLAKAWYRYSHKARVATFKPGAFQSEQTWIVHQIGRNILDQVEFATNRQLPDKAGTKLELSPGSRSMKYQVEARFKGLRTTTMDVELKNYLWSPDNFVPFCKTLLNSAQAKVPSPANRPDAEYISSLTNPTPELLMREDRLISAALTKDPLDPFANEEAALLIGSFAMRQPGGTFADIRPELSAITAHLALAKAARGQFSACGQLAEAILCALVGRETPAGEILDRLQHTADGAEGLPSNSLTIWSRALKMRTTGDYQLLDQPEKASLLERLEYFRAIRHSVNSTAAAQFASSGELERLSEWSALILDGSFSVEESNNWAPRLLRDEMDECVAQFRNYSGHNSANDEWVSALNAPWTRVRKPNDGPLSYDVLGWGAWAQQHQRRLCSAMEITSIWLDCKLGLPKDAKEFESVFAKRFQKLDLFTLVKFSCCREPEVEEAFGQRVADIFAKHPEWVSFPKWEEASQLVHKKMTRDTQPGPRPVIRQNPVLDQGWYEDRFVFGTLYDIDNRLTQQHSPFARVSDIELESLKQMAPSNFQVSYQHLLLVQRRKHSGGPEFVSAEFKDLSRYHVRAMKQIADSLRFDRARYRVAFEKLCRFEPDRYIELGAYLVSAKDEEGAAAAYRKAFESAPDRVYVSNSMEWLVNYCYDHDQKDEAMKIAEHGAEVYSHAGLVTMAKLLERMDRLDEAEAYLRKTKERYDSSVDLRDFYIRNHDKSPRYAEAENQLQRETFPYGMEKVVTSAELRDAPRDGVILAKGSARTTKAGLQPNDVFVVVNRVRVHNFEQYRFARAPMDNPKVSFIVWRKDHYVELKDADFPSMRDGAAMESYSTGKSSKR